MSLLLKKGVDRLAVPRQLVTQQKRFRGKINIQRPQKLFYERALVTEFVKPYYPRKQPFEPIWEACTLAKPKEQKEEIEHPYQRIIARELYQRFEDSKMVAFLHKNSMKEDAVFDMKVALHKAGGMSLKAYGRGVIGSAVRGTRYEVILPLFLAPSFLVFSPEPNVEALNKIVKKTAEVFLIAGILEGKLLNVNDFLKYGEMNITEARSGLVHTLQLAAGVNLNRQLNHHQSTLVSRLDQIGKSENDVKTSTVDSKSDEITTE